jgi:hypothetical protein
VEIRSYLPARGKTICWCALRNHGPVSPPVVPRKGKALLIDCRALEYKLLPLHESVRLVIGNSMVRHASGNQANTTRRRADLRKGR